MKILIVNGPNINMLGIREKGVYGNETYGDLLHYLQKWAEELDIEIECYQSNYEGDIVTKIQEAYQVFDGIVINPAAYTHTSIAILDALKAVNIPTIEVHISDTGKREDFRKVSYIREYCISTIQGLGFEGYQKALVVLSQYINKREQ